MMKSIFRRVICEGVGRKFSSGGAPLLMLPPTFRGDGEMEYNLYSPSKEECVSLKGKGGKEEAELMRDNKTKLVGSSHGWLALLKAGSGELLLSNPLSGERVKLPTFRPLDESEEAVENIRHKAFKVILSCSPKEPGCRALMIPSGCPAVDRVAFCCPGRSSASDHWWTPMKTSYDYVDYVYSAARRRFFGCVPAHNGNEHLQSWSWDMNVSESEYNPRITDLPAIDLFEQHLEQDRTYLVSGGDQLFIVCLKLITHCTPWRELEFVVFTTDHESGGLQLCSSLDGLVMFVGNISHSVALPASQFPDLKPNSIYFSEDVLCGIRYVGIFDYQNRLWSPCCYPPGLHLQEFDTTSSLAWFTPTLD